MRRAAADTLPVFYCYGLPFTLFCQNHFSFRFFTFNLNPVQIFPTTFTTALSIRYYFRPINFQLLTAEKLVSFNLLLDL